jgi:hypothetical protein
MPIISPVIMFYRKMPAELIFSGTPGDVKRLTVQTMDEQRRQLYTEYLVIRSQYRHFFLFTLYRIAVSHFIIVVPVGFVFEEAGSNIINSHFGFRNSDSYMS